MNSANFGCSLLCSRHRVKGVRKKTKNFFAACGWLVAGKQMGKDAQEVYIYNLHCIPIFDMEEKEC